MQVAPSTRLLNFDQRFELWTKKHKGTSSPGSENHPYLRPWAKFKILVDGATYILINLQIKTCMAKSHEPYGLSGGVLVIWSYL